ncbi:MAG: M48 family metallopeptidase [Leptospirales bacterium]|nr:M48 family metallopeptidase [Leptospirales bacterium]
MTRIRLLALALVATLPACAIIDKYTLPSDAEMGAKGSQYFTELKSQMTIENNARINAYVKCIANNLLQVAHDDTGVGQWEIVVFRTDAINAFAIPGGKIGVFTGLLQVARDQDQLAAVIGHEIGHVNLRHSARQQRSSSLADKAISGVGAALGGSQYSQYKDIAVTAGQLGAKYGLLLPFGRGQESEADLYGLELMSNAGFKPTGAVELWQNMAAAAGGSHPMEFTSTHPSHETRIGDLNDAMPENFLLYQAAQAQGKKPNCHL